MKRKVLLFLAIQLSLFSFIHAQGTSDTPYYKYRVYLTDKKASEFSIRKPEQFLSERALARRKRQGIKIDETDLPVPSTYLQQLRNQGVDVWSTSKWNNTVVVGCTDPAVMSKVSALPFVLTTRQVAVYTETVKRDVSDRKNNQIEIERDMSGSSYRNAYDQIAQLNGIALHGAGFRGEGMVIAVLDGGFFNADVVTGLAKTKILGTKDFVTPNGNVYDEDPHGMMVLSCIGANEPGWQIGTAPEASFWLLRSEDGNSEQLVEEDNWCAAVEFADSVGADVLNSSLGYTNFDSNIGSLSPEDINGRTHINSRTASMIASKGMILCNSAGNSGRDEWGKIGVPADATDILAVGAIDHSGKITVFSSRGYSADGRVKPDVVALGGASSVYDVKGRLSMANGTSFSSPTLSGMVACLWQALPHLNAYQIMDLIRRSGDRYDNPDESYGYGLPDFFQAYTMGLIEK